MLTVVQDLDYTYSTQGDVPVYIHSLSFPPSYFHRVVRVPGDPIAHADLAPWAPQLSASVRLLQDRVRSEGHTLVRWVHRARFTLRPRAAGGRIQILGTSLYVDSGWYGTIVVEVRDFYARMTWRMMLLQTEGTNEGLADLMARIGMNAQTGAPIPGWHPPQVGDPRRTYRILRDRR
jgi:hypothetical protein